MQTGTLKESFWWNIFTNNLKVPTNNKNKKWWIIFFLSTYCSNMLITIDNSLGRNQTAGHYLKKHLSPGAKPPSWRAWNRRSRGKSNKDITSSKKLMYK